MSQKLLYSLALLLLANLLRAQAFERTYQLPGDTLYTVDSLAETDDNYFVYLSQGQETDQLTIDKISGEQLAFGSYEPPLTACIDTAGAAIGGNFFVRARRDGANSVLVERVERMGACNSGELRVANAVLLPISEVDTLAVGGVAYDRSTNSVYVVGGSSTISAPGADYPVQVRQYIIGLNATNLERDQFNLSDGFGFFAPLLETELVSLEKNVGIYVRGYQDQRPSQGISFIAFTTNLATPFEIFYKQSPEACSFTVKATFYDYIEIASSERCYGKCDPITFTVFQSPTRRSFSLPTIATCLATTSGGSSVITKFPSPDTGIIFSGYNYTSSLPRNQPVSAYYEKLGTASDWRYEEDPNSNFLPDPIGLGTTDGGAIFVDAQSGGVLQLRKFDGKGRLSPPQIDIAVGDLKILDSTVQGGDVLFYNFELSNVGDQRVREDFVILAYISTDTILDDTDLQEGRVETGNIEVGSIERQVPGASTLPQNLAPGKYTLFLVADARKDLPDENRDNNVISSRFCVTGDTTVGLTTFVESGVFVGPNPTSGVLSVRLPQVAGVQSYKVFDATGRLTLKGELAGGTQTLELSSLPQGVYTLSIPGLRASTRVIKQ